MSTFIPLSARYRIPHGVEHQKKYVTDLLLPQTSSVYTVNHPCDFCYHEVYLQPQMIHATQGQWTAHQQTSHHLFYPQESMASENQRQTKTKIEYKKPKVSYVELIAGAILSSPEKHLVLGDIYEAIIEKYPYFETRGNGWRNSIRHNLSLSDCFVKGERSPNGKGHFWEVNFEYYGSNGAKGKSKLTKKKLGALPKQNDYNRKELKPENGTKEEPLSGISGGAQKLSLLSHFRFDEEIRDFEIARQKLTEAKKALNGT